MPLLKQFNFEKRCCEPKQSRCVASDYDLAVGLLKYLKSNLWSVAYDETFTLRGPHGDEALRGVLVVRVGVSLVAVGDEDLRISPTICCSSRAVSMERLVVISKPVGLHLVLNCGRV